MAVACRAATTTGTRRAARQAFCHRLDNAHGHSALRSKHVVEELKRTIITVLELPVRPLNALFDTQLVDEKIAHWAIEQRLQRLSVKAFLPVVLRVKQTERAIGENVPVEIHWDSATCLADRRNGPRVEPIACDLERELSELPECIRHRNIPCNKRAVRRRPHAQHRITAREHGLNASRDAVRTKHRRTHLCPHGFGGEDSAAAAALIRAAYGFELEERLGCDVTGAFAGVTSIRCGSFGKRGPRC